MSVTTKRLVRVFKFDGTEYPDPSPGASKDKSLELLAIANPKLNNAALDGPFFEAGKEVWQIKVAAGTKG